MNLRPRSAGHRPSWSGSWPAYEKSATGRPEPIFTHAESRRTRPRRTSGACSGTARLADPRMVQCLPAEPERGFALECVVVQRRDKDPVPDGPQGAEAEPIQDRADRPSEVPRVAEDPVHERDEAYGTEEEEDDSGAEDALLVPAPPLSQEGTAATECPQRSEAFDDHRRENEQGRDRPAVSEDPRDEPSARLRPNRRDPEEHARSRREQRPEDDLEEARVRRREAVEHVRPSSLEPHRRRADDGRHEVHGEEVRHQVGDEDLLVEESARGRSRREAERQDADHDDQPDEAREDEGEERQRHQPRVPFEDA